MKGGHLTPAQKKRPVLGVRLPREKAERLRRISDETGVPVQVIIERQIDEWDRKYEESKRREPDMDPERRIIDSSVPLPLAPPATNHNPTDSQEKEISAEDPARPSAPNYVNSSGTGGDKSA